MDATLTLVTATLNRRPLLERAIASAVREGVAGVQHIVVDGGSTDGTLAMLARFPHLEVVSEPDRNLYDGWNKGIARARGAYVAILNSDDEIPEGALSEVRRLAARHPEADLISGPVLLTRSIDGAKAHSVVIDDARMLRLRHQDIGPGVPLTNGRFLSRGLLDRVGPFDIRYPVVSDRQFLLRVLAIGAVNVTTEKPLYRYHVHGGSLTLNDRAPSLAHALECLCAARDGLAEAGAPELRRAYLRWNSWATVYLAGLHWRGGHRRDALSVVAQGLARDPWLLGRIAPQVARHWSERQARLGRPVAA